MHASRVRWAPLLLLGALLGCDDGATATGTGSSTGATSSTGDVTSSSSSGMGGSGSTSASSGDTTSSASSGSGSGSSSSSSSTGGGAGKSGGDFVGAGHAMQSGNYSLRFTFGQATVHQSNLSSTNFQLHGGLVGATESVP
ncbi:MAG: hypothetical protein U0414_29090 [Polyangiaceae bacterium]